MNTNHNEQSLIVERFMQLQNQAKNMNLTLDSSAGFGVLEGSHLLFHGQTVAEVSAFLMGLRFIMKMTDESKATLQDFKDSTAWQKQDSLIHQNAYDAGADDALKYYRQKFIP